MVQHVVAGFCLSADHTTSFHRRQPKGQPTLSTQDKSDLAGTDHANGASWAVHRAAAETRARRIARRIAGIASPIARAKPLP